MSVYQRVVDVSQFGGDHLEAEPFQVAFFSPRSGQCQGAELFDTGFQMAVATTTTLGL